MATARIAESELQEPIIRENLRGDLQNVLTRQRRKRISVYATTVGYLILGNLSWASEDIDLLVDFGQVKTLASIGGDQNAYVTNYGYLSIGPIETNGIVTLLSSGTTLVGGNLVAAEGLALLFGSSLLSTHLYIGTGDKGYTRNIAEEEARGYTITMGGERTPYYYGQTTIISNLDNRLLKVESGFFHIASGSFLTIGGSFDTSKKRLLEIDYDEVDHKGGSILQIDKTNIDFYTTPPLKKGDFLPLMSAGAIFAGSKTPFQLSTNTYYSDHYDARVITSGIGNIEFTGKIENGLSLFPEIVSAGCSIEYTLASNCSIEVFGARAARVLPTRQLDRYEIPVIGSAQQANELLKGDRVNNAIHNSRSVYNTDPYGETNAENVISFHDDGNLRLVAKLEQTSSNESYISITFRGTVPFRTNNLLADEGFINSENVFLREYIHNSASFISTIVRANPETTIRLEGHSLGGGLANFFGYITGFESIAFNAPDTSNLIRRFNQGLFDYETSFISNIVQRDDWSHILNIRNYGDLVSGRRLGSDPQFGQTITIRTRNSDFDAITEELRILSVTKNLNLHGIVSVMDSVTFADLSSIWGIAIDGVQIYGVFNPLPEEERAIKTRMMERLIFRNPYDGANRVQTSGSAMNGLEHDVEAADLLYLLNAPVGSDLLFTFGGNSSLFDQLALPLFGESSARISISALVDSDWVFIGDFLGGDIVALPLHYKSIRFRTDFDMASFYADDELWFGVSFSSAGKYVGAVSAVPDILPAQGFSVGVIAVIFSILVQRRNFRHLSSTTEPHGV